MKDILKIAKTFIFLLLAIALISNFIYWRYPLNYLSYRTGFKVETINNLLEVRHDRLTLSPSEYEQACKSFNSVEVTKAYTGLAKTSLFLIGFSFIAIVLFVLALKLNKTNSFNLSKKDKFAIALMLFVAFLMFGLADLREWDLDFLTICKESVTNGNLF